MGNYITSADIIAFVGAECDATTAGLLVDMSEALFNQMVGSADGLQSSSKTEYHDPRDFKPGKLWRVFYLKTYKPTVITTVNGASPGTLNTHYTLVGRRLEFETGKDLPTTFPYRYTVVYTSGLATIPGEIKTSCLYIAKGLFDKKVYADVTSFRQDLLAVNFNAGTKMIDIITDPSQASFINLIVSKYIVPYFYAI